MTTYQPTAHANLLRHLERHQYTKGEYKGQAPADKTRRHKSHFRVLHSDQDLVVRFHRTDILTADPDGTVTLNTDSWCTAPTTREAMHVALDVALGRPCWLRSDNRNGYINTVLSIYGVASYVYYDGMQLDSTGKLLTNPQPLVKLVKDKTKTQAFRELAKPFLDVLPVLHSACDPTNQTFRGAGIGYLANVLQDPEDWADLVYAFYRPTAKETWQAIYRAATKNMNTTIKVPL